jgi:hypothetical protein
MRVEFISDVYNIERLLVRYCSNVRALTDNRSDDKG